MGLSANIDMLLMMENYNKVTICHAIHRYAKTCNKYIENYDKHKESSYPKYSDVNNLYA